MNYAKKIIIITSIVYAVFLLLAVVFLFNNFTSSPETNFVFRIIAVGILAYVLTYPLIIASSSEIDTPIWVKILLFILYVGLEVGFIWFALKLFDDNTFMYNKDISPEAFDNAAENFTAWYWIATIVMGAGNIATFIVKIVKDWDDWTFALLIPLAPLIVPVSIAVLVVSLIVFMVMGMFSESSSSSSYSYSDSEESSSSDDTFEEQKRVGDSYYDAQGYLRNSNDSYYDYQGYLRNPGDNYYDSQGNYRRPGESYYDGKGYYRRSNECYYDSEGMLRDPGDDKN